MINVPNTNTFSLQNVYDSVNSHDATVQGNLSSCFDKSVDSYFDPLYGSKTMNPKTLYGFRNYTPIELSQPRAVAVVNGQSIYLSTDYGLNWTVVSSNSDWRRCAVSSDGKYILINHNSFGSVARAVDSTWSSVLTTSWDWDAVAMSSDGNYQIAVSTLASPSLGYVYYSTDYGANWSQSNCNSDDWQVAAVSGSGAVMYIGSPSGTIYVSTDFGFSFNSSNTPGGTNSVIDLATNYDGDIVCAVVIIPTNNYYLYISTDYGQTWNFVSVLSGLGFVAMSYSGQYITFCHANGNIHRSTNYGVSFSLASATGAAFTGITMNGTGQYQLASSNGYLYRSDNYGSSWTAITSAGSRQWADVAL